VSIYGEYSGKIFNTDLSAVAATYIHWRLPGLGSRVAVTVWLPLQQANELFIYDNRYRDHRN